MTRPPLTLLLDFDDQVRRDRDQPAAFLHRRDRRFALACEAAGEAPGPARWLDQLNAVSSTRRKAGPHPWLRGWQRFTRLFAIAGALLGVMAMLGLLFYDGSQQINVTVILGFIAFQLLLAVATSLQSLMGWRPWGPLADWILHRFQGREASPAGWAQRRLQPQLMAQSAHTGGLIFGLAGLMTLIVLVVVQDLAFGWSTTLDTGPGTFHRLVEIIAMPWQSLWPAAVPSPELVAESRFYRLTDTPQAVAASRWGDWWPFVAMSWLFYVITPRFFLLILTRLHLRWRAHHLLAKHPGLTALRYRMETPALETGSQYSDSADQPDLSTQMAVQPLPASGTLVRWAGAASVAEARLLTDSPAPLVLDAGGSSSLQADRATLEAAGLNLQKSGGAGLVLARAWEPPTGELADFLEEARDRWPKDVEIALVPAGHSVTLRPPPQHLDQWLRFAERHPDLRLVVCHPSRNLENAGNPEPHSSGPEDREMLS
ncbi:DUF2868 domain-containing protein [Marinobacter sp.]|uniref:DUF2868 domain-containing protein n=1 Tax=Marinobacter sp. TaxID=50741 RepID=UPI00384FD17D